jgi:hypothetical protein
MHRIAGTRGNPAGAAKAGAVLAFLLLICLGLAACGSSGSSTTTSAGANAAATSGASAGAGPSTGAGPTAGAGPAGSTARRSGAFGRALGRLNTPAYRQKLRTFAACMRANGVNLHEPNFSGKGPVFNTREVQPTSEQFRVAEDKCRAGLHR